ncbi:MAG: SpoIID/LytB domain-containing protein [Bacteroidales bacterium]|nr:SpoIID/LytB domain-containing protein [Bacteroidales bacterium]
MINYSHMRFEPAPQIEIGIVKAERIQFSLEGDYLIRGKEESGYENAEATLIDGSIVITQKEECFDVEDSVIFDPTDTATGRFVIRDVVIGIGFHWEQKEDQEFQGALKLMVSGNGIQVVNIISVEDYLISVISSEMRGDSSPALLKAHTIISRSWLLAQIEKQDALEAKETSYELIHETEDEYIRWYDREDHDEFHVCADDHCQRYQGITRAHNPEVVKAVTETAGEVLVYDGKICDARFSKCCGGKVEVFENVWEPVSHPYLQKMVDNDKDPIGFNLNLKEENAAESWIFGNPEAFCNTHDKKVLSQVLNDYDQETNDFYCWKVTYKQNEISKLIYKRIGIDFGLVQDFIPIERGESGRLVKLKIVGTQKTMTIGKELEIRKALSESHLYSSGIVFDKKEIDGEIVFILKGAGWGHGVGLCQIGAAVMGDKGYVYKEILNHYFQGAKLEKRY